MDVRDRVALITGASSGIGLAIAEQLASAGARVVIHGRDVRRVAEVAAHTGGIALTCDLALDGAAPELAIRAMDAAGPVDILVASAGFGRSVPFSEMPDADIEALVAVDLVAPIRLCRALLPGMIRRGEGRVVLVSSVAGRTGVAGEAVYAACKAGLDAFAESLRLELVGSGVGVTVVVPAAVRTRFFDSRGRPYGHRLPRPVSAETVARATVDAITHDRAEAWVPRWVRVAPVVRLLAPGAFRRLSTRYGEHVRVNPPQEPGP